MNIQLITLVFNSSLLSSIGPLNFIILAPDLSSKVENLKPLQVAQQIEEFDYISISDRT